MTATVLIVGYRAYAELERCLISLHEHEPHARVVLLDHDADEHRGRALVEKFPQVLYLPRSQNLGFAAGVNSCVAHAGEGPLLLLNPDCELTGPVLALLADVFARNPRVGIAGGVVVGPTGVAQPSGRRFPDATTAVAGRTGLLSRLAPGNPLTRRNLASRPVASTTPVDWVTGAFMYVRRETFDQVGGFDEGFFLYWEDADFCRRAANAGWTTVYSPTAAVVHATARSSRFAPARSLWAFHYSAFRYYWKHGSWMARSAGPFVALGLAGRFLVKLPRRMLVARPYGCEPREWPLILAPGPLHRRRR